MVIVIIREDLITEDTLAGTPTMLKYKTHADHNSLYNTPPAYGIYICGKVFQWLKKRGGLSAMKEYNEKKAKILYDFLDQSKLFQGTVVKQDRSLMNVPFVTGNEELDAKFVKEAKTCGFENLKGHRTVQVEYYLLLLLLLPLLLIDPKSLIRALLHYVLILHPPVQVLLSFHNLL